MTAKKLKPDPSTTATLECRLFFLRAASEDPHIKLGDSLREAVFKPCKQRWTELGLPVPNKPTTEYSVAQMTAATAFSDEQSRLVQKWAADQNLDYEWVQWAAMQELRYSEFPALPFAAVPGYLAPEFIWTSWFFGHESEATYKKRIKASFQEALDAYTRRVKLERGRFLNHRFAQQCHYSWAAEHVCLGRRFSDIASKVTPPRTEQAIRKAVLTILNRIGIPSNYNLQKAKKRTS